MGASTAGRMELSEDRLARYLRATPLLPGHDWGAREWRLLLDYRGGNGRGGDPFVVGRDNFFLRCAFLRSLFGKPPLRKPASVHHAVCRETAATRRRFSGPS